MNREHLSTEGHFEYWWIFLENLPVALQLEAQGGDLFMSLIHICELNHVNPFDYLTELQRHAEVVRKDPNAWMPWNYREALTNGPPSDS